jgi:hypothetical protein
VIIVAMTMSCTWYRGGSICEQRSPAVDDPDGLHAAAVAAGWRIWFSQAAGVGDPLLHPGEALCPLHKHEPSLGIRSKAAQ